MSDAPPAGAASTVLSRETRARLVEAATRAFAAHGVRNASLLDITRQAGQRNRGAVHYHFGSRTGLLIAVLDQHVDFLGVRERELLAFARTRPDDDLASAVEAIVRPTTELAATGWSGRCFLVIVADLIAEEETAALAAVSETLVRSGGVEVYELIEQRLPPLPGELREERLALMTAFVLRAVADRARALDEDVEAGRLRRPQLDDERFVANLVAMTVAMLRAPA
ncbi:TetR family transcriptional regulator [Nocardioides fonticola]|uniref:TetR family transcriptional regulator n=1 Tax=Nocardioides fonticola TaxID=450363 RepID=A0ABP7XEL4_9ACTN